MALVPAVVDAVLPQSPLSAQAALPMGAILPPLSHWEPLELGSARASSPARKRFFTPGIVNPFCRRGKRTLFTAYCSTEVGQVHSGLFLACPEMYDSYLNSPSPSRSPEHYRRKRLLGNRDLPNQISARCTRR